MVSRSLSSANGDGVFFDRRGDVEWSNRVSEGSNFTKLVANQLNFDVAARLFLRRTRYMPSSPKATLAPVRALFQAFQTRRREWMMRIPATAAVALMITGYFLFCCDLMPSSTPIYQ